MDKIPRRPDYKDEGSNCAIWVNEGEDSSTILNVKLANGFTFICHKQEEKKVL